MSDETSPAEQASKRALEAMYACLEQGKSFRLEAGAGAGKTYSLIKALKFLIAKNAATMPKRGQRIACITYTNVAKDEITARTDASPIVFCDTNHSFCWSLISGFQKALKELVATLPSWQEKLAGVGGAVGDRRVEYSLGHRSLKGDRLFLHHDDVLPLTIALMEHAKFRQIVADRFPIILVDEYQDTDKDWVAAIKKHFLGTAGAPLLGFFGDHWQKIYEGGCGKLDHPSIVEIGKEANFRSVAPVVECLNRMRPELPQFVEDPAAPGEVHVFHTNAWSGQRQRGAHWGGDLPADVARIAMNSVREILADKGWDLSSSTKVLMLTHRLLAAEQGYEGIQQAFRFTEAFSKKEDPHIAYFVDQLEPACEAFASKKFGAMFEALGRGSIPLLRAHADKQVWHTAMTRILELRKASTVGDLVDHLMLEGRPRIPDVIERKERELKGFDRSGEDPLPESLAELERFRQVKYAEVVSLRRYLQGHSPFETKHGVKGAEFENVLVVLGRGWNKYNFGEMLELASSGVPAARAEAFERNRNLFYVACSRPRRRLALLFTQQLSGAAMGTLERWFGPQSLVSLTL